MLNTKGNMKITNYQKINNFIHTSGQPTKEEFKLIRAQGVDTVLNLAMLNSTNAIPNEGEYVIGHGMNYLHIPVVWEHPKQEQFDLFSNIMSFHKEKSIWVHCALNWRVSCFIFLYRTKVLGHSPLKARTTMEQIWFPNEVWSRFMNGI